MENIHFFHVNVRLVTGSGEAALNVGKWVDVVMSGAGTDRPLQSLLLLVGALR